MLKLFGSALFLVSFAVQTNADIIMTVDLSDPSAAVFSSTSANAQNTFVDAADSLVGIALLDFFAGNTVASDDGFLDLGGIYVFDSSAGTTRRPLAMLSVGEFSGGYTTNDINFWDLEEFFLVTFLSSKRALVGSATDDLSLFTNLPETGAVGDIVVGEPDLGQVVGQWHVVVPEPSAAWNILGVAIGLIRFGWSRRVGRVHKRGRAAPREKIGIYGGV